MHGEVEAKAASVVSEVVEAGIPFIRRHSHYEALAEFLAGARPWFLCASPSGFPLLMP